MSDFYGKEYTIASLLEVGVHYGHKKNYWNPKMAEFIYGIKDNVHIIDLRKTVEYLEKALTFLRSIAAKNGRILFVSTKKQARDAIADNAKRCGQYYVNYRWFGGMLTNWKTISNSIKTLNRYEEMLASEEASLYTKKERLNIERKRNKLELALGGIRKLGKLPDVLFVIGLRESHCAVAEAHKLGIPIIAIADTNVNIDSIDYIIPGNDDSRKAIELYCKLAAEAVLLGIEDSVSTKTHFAAFKNEGGKKPSPSSNAELHNKVKKMPKNAASVVEEKLKDMKNKKESSKNFQKTDQKTDKTKTENTIDEVKIEEKISINEDTGVITETVVESEKTSN